MKKTITILVLAALVCMLSACGQAPAETAPTETTASAATLPPETAPAPAEADFEKLESLLGLDDGAAADYFGGGEENWTEDRSAFIGRIYHVSLFDQPVKVFTSYGSDETVASVSAWVTDGSREVSEDEVKAWVQRITDYAAGEPAFDGTTSEAGSQNWKWKKGDVFITLHWLGDIVTIEFLPAVGELH